MSMLHKINQTVIAGIVTATAILAGCAQDAAISPDAAALSAKVAKLEAQVAELRSRQDIQEVYVRYGRGIDRLDEENYRKAFWPDAQINYGTLESITPEQHWENHMIKGFKAQAKVWGHLLTNQAMDVDGDVAHVETYLTVMAIPKEKGGFLDHMNIWAGRYVDKLERRGGEWRIAVREYMPQFSMKADVAEYDALWGSYFKGAQSDCIQQAAGKRDVAYARPLNRRTKEAGPPCAEE